MPGLRPGTGGTGGAWGGVPPGPLLGSRTPNQTGPPPSGAFARPAGRSGAPPPHRKPRPGTGRRRRVWGPPKPRQGPGSGRARGEQGPEAPARHETTQAGRGAGSPRDLSSAREHRTRPARRPAVRSLDLRGDPARPHPTGNLGRGVGTLRGVPAGRANPPPGHRAVRSGFASRGDAPEGHRPTPKPPPGPRQVRAAPPKPRLRREQAAPPSPRPGHGPGPRPAPARPAGKFGRAAGRRR